MPAVPESKLFIGIDPGIKGGLVSMLCEQGESPQFILTHMPDTEQEIWEWLRVAKCVDSRVRVYATIEQVHAMPGQGVSSSFTFGRGYGALRMACIAAGIELDEVTPQQWHKALGIPPRKKTPGEKELKGRRKGGAYDKWKCSVRDIAKGMFPWLYLWNNTAEKFQLAVCDALLIAEYSRRKHEREP